MFLARDRDRDRTFFSYLKYQVNNVKKIHAYADHDHDHATHEVLRYGTKNVHEPRTKLSLYLASIP